jgi:hypothetical protein
MNSQSTVILAKVDKAESSLTYEGGELKKLFALIASEIGHKAGPRSIELNPTYSGDVILKVRTYGQNIFYTPHAVGKFFSDWICNNTSVSIDQIDCFWKTSRQTEPVLLITGKRQDIETLASEVSDKMDERFSMRTKINKHLSKLHF